MKRTLGVVLAALLFFTVFTPAVMAGPAVPVSPVLQEEDEEEEEGLLEIALGGLLFTPPGGEKTGCPYTPLTACLNFIVPPVVGPLTTSLPYFLELLIPVIDTVLKHPGAISKAIEVVLRMVYSNPYGVISLIELILNPFSLSLLNPLTWPTDPNCRSLFAGIELQDFCLSPAATCQTCLTNCSGEIGNWLVGLSLLKLLPGVISLVESLQVE